MADYSRLALAAAFALAFAAPLHATEPVIDMHVHATFTERAAPIPGCTGDQPLLYLPLDPVKSPPDADLTACAKPILSPTKRDDFEARTIAELRRNNVRRAVLIGRPEELSKWQVDAPGLFVPATVPAPVTNDKIDRIRALASAGKIKVLAEFGPQYLGMRADDPSLEPFWALAEELDLPVGIHLTEGVVLSADEIGTDPFRASLTTPFQLEEVLHKHPKLRIYIMHSASPLIDETISMLFTYPSLYVDVSANDWNMPRAQFYDELKRLVDAGFSKRILFGSDQTIWPQAIGLAIGTINAAPFLTREQKRDILYNNAARFLRLTPEEIAADQRP